MARAEGGKIEGRGEGSDGILVQLDNSYVIPKSIAEKYGWDGFKAMNATALELAEALAQGQGSYAIDEVDNATR